MEMANDLNTLTISAKKLHPKCSTGSQMRLRLNVLYMWGVDRLQVHGIRSNRQVYREVVEARS